MSKKYDEVAQADELDDSDHQSDSVRSTNDQQYADLRAQGIYDGDDNADRDDTGNSVNPEDRNIEPKRQWKQQVIGGFLIICGIVIIALSLTVFTKPPQEAPADVTDSPSPINDTIGAASSTSKGNNGTSSTIWPSAAPSPKLLSIIAVTNAPMAPAAFHTNSSIISATTNMNISMASSFMDTSTVNITNSWQQLGSDSISTLLPSIPGDSSGFSVSLSGTGKRLAVGSPDTDTESEGTKAGSVTIMEDDGNGTWTEVGTLKGTVPEEQFGVSVAFSEDGRFVTIGSLKSEAGGGAVRVYRITSSANSPKRHMLTFIDTVNRSLAPKSEHGTNFTDALSQYATATGIHFDGNLSAYANSLQGAVENVTESGNFSSIVDGNTATNPGNLIGLLGSLGKPSAIIVPNFLGDSNNTNISSTSAPNDFATMLTDAATAKGLTFDGNLDSYIEKLKVILQSVAATKNMTSITDGSSTITTVDLMNIAGALQNTSSSLLGPIPNETQSNLTDSNATSLNSSLKQAGPTLSHKKSANGDLFGISTSMSSDGHQLAVGAPHTDGNAGGAFVYKYDQIYDDWKIMDIPSEAKPDDYLGWSVAMSGDGSTLAVGAPHRTNKLPGYVDLYSMVGDSWVKVKTFTPKDLKGGIAAGIESDDFGFSVSLDRTGQTLVIGAPNSTVVDTAVKKQVGRERGKGKAAAGYVVVFTKGVSSDWTQMGNVMVGETGVQLGYSVSTSLAGNRIVAGAPNRAGGVGTAQVYQFDELEKEWEMAPIISSTATGADTGFSVSMSSSGGQISVGSPFLTECKNAGTGCEPGKVQVFQDPAAFDTSSLPIS